jgi:hypothetical protein
MKRRIEKLFNEAGFHKPEVERLGIEHKFEKFAELLVKECMTVARGADGLDATHEAWYLIKQHFGVEE